MQLLPKHHHLRPLIYQLMTLGGVAITFCASSVAYGFRVQVLWLILSVLFLFFPCAGKRSVPDKQCFAKHYGLGRAIATTLLLQLVLISACYVICYTTEFGFPTNSVAVDLFPITVWIVYAVWGAFPWGVYALLAAGLYHVVYIQRKPGTISNLIQPIVRNKPKDTISLTIDVSMKMANLLTLVATLGICVMACAYLLAHMLDLKIAYGARSDILLVILLTLKYTQNRVFRRPLSWCRKRGYSAAIIMTLFVGCLSLVVFGITVLLAEFSPRFTPGLAHAFSFAPSNWSAIWLIFIAMWCLGWAPQIAGRLIYIWRGYRVRTMLFWTLFLPVTLSVCCKQVPLYLTLPDHAKTWNLILVLFATLGTISLFVRNNHLVYASKASAPLNLTVKRAAPLVFVQNLLQGIIFVVAVYLGSNIYAIGFLWFSLMAPAGVFLLLGALATFRIFKQK